MENLLKNKVLLAQIAVFLLIGAWVFMNSYHYADLERRSIDPPDGDEQMWTGASITSYKMFFDNHLRDSVLPDQQWFERFANPHGISMRDMTPSERQWFDFRMWTFGWKAPNVGKYIMGRKIVKSVPDVDPNGYFVFDPRGGVPECNPPRELIALARYPNAFMNALGIMLIFLAGWLFLHFGVGLVAALYLNLNYFYNFVNTSVGLDSSSVFFATTTMLLALFYIKALYKKWHWGIVLGLAVGVGFSFALAVGSKLNSALIGFIAMIVFAMIFFYAVKGYLAKPKQKPKPKAKAAAKSKVKKKTTEKAAPAKTEKAKHSPYLQQIYLLAGSAVIIGFLTFKVFLYTNPVYQDEPFKKVKIVRESVDEFFSIRAKSKDLTHIKEEWMASFGLVTKRCFVLTQDKYNEKRQWYQFYGTFGKLMQFKFNFLDGLFLFLGLGIALYFGIRGTMRKQEVSALLFLGIFCAITIYGNVDFLWNDFARYMTPMLPSISLMVGIAIIWLINLGFKKAKPEWQMEIQGLEEK